jgi:hypothetical protein
MNYDAVKDILNKVNGATFAGIDTVTQVKLKGGKKNPLQGRVTKKTQGSTVMLFTNKNSNSYSNMVKRRLEQEGKDVESFELKPRAWGQRIENSPFVEHKEKKYLECIFIKGGKSVYMIDDKEADVVSIEGLDITKPSAESQGGLDNKVVIRTFAIDSINKMRVFGEKIA